MRKTLIREIRYARGALALSIILGSLGTAATIAQMAFLSRVTSQVFLDHKHLVQVLPLLLLLLGSIIVHAILAWGREVSAQQGAIRVKAALRERLFGHLLQLGPAYSKGERTGELVATASEGIERLDAYVSRYLPQIALSILTPLLIAIAIFPFDWISAVLLVVTGPVIPLLMVLVGSHAEERTKRQWVALSRMSAHFLDAVQGLPTLKLFGRSGTESERIARISNEYREKTMQVLRIAFLSGMILELMVAFAIALVAVMLGIRLLNGDISFEHAFFVLLLTPEFYHPLRELGVQRHAGIEGKAALERITEILNTPLPTQEDTTSTQPLVGELTLELSNVTYTYPGHDHPALNNVTLTLPAGTCTALVGRSGAGKSTLANLLLRFIDAQAGMITANGLPLTALPVETWREHVGLVPQRPYLFPGSVRDNIRLARPGASEHEVEQAAELAGASEFIARLPQGYDTEIGERGSRLSAGQIQRLAIARAFLKDAPLLILDEPTSSLDPESETLIRQALERLVQGRTVLVIAHRYNTIAHAQQIAVLEDGQQPVGTDLSRPGTASRLVPGRDKSVPTGCRGVSGNVNSPTIPRGVKI